jgi:outer membrane immunogenic protein
MVTKAPPPPEPAAPYNWSGFYFGANAGAGWGSSCWTFEGFVPPDARPQNDGCQHLKSGLFGGQNGFNWQAGAWVFGLEGEADWSNLKGSNRPALGNNNQFNVDSTNLRGISTVTGRVGYADDRFLLYVKGGAAWARAKYEVDTTATPFGGPVVATTGLDNVYRSGWTVGTGLEYGLSPNWSVAVEYDYLNFGTRQETMPSTVFPPATFAAITEDVKLSVQMATLRLNYRLTPPGANSDVAPIATKAAAAKPVTTWAGFYVGLNAGGHWGTDKTTAAADPAGWTRASAAAIDATLPGSAKVAGFEGGEQLGYNFQSGWTVYGIEADEEWLSSRGSRVVGGIPSINPADLFITTTQPAWLGTVRARLGAAFDKGLLYITGGAAYSGVNFTDTFGSFGNTIHSSVSEAPGVWGWTAGTGLEWAIDRRWSVKIEYLYADFKSVTTRIANTVGSDISISHKYSENLARVGLNYHLGDPRTY